MVARDSEGPKAHTSAFDAASHAVAVNGSGSSPENRRSDLPTILRFRIAEESWTVFVAMLRLVARMTGH